MVPSSSYWRRNQTRARHFLSEIQFRKLFAEAATSTSLRQFCSTSISSDALDDRYLQQRFLNLLKFQLKLNFSDPKAFIGANAAGHPANLQSRCRMSIQLVHILSKFMVCVEAVSKKSFDGGVELLENLLICLDSLIQFLDYFLNAATVTADGRAFLIKDGLFRALLSTVTTYTEAFEMWCGDDAMISKLISLSDVLFSYCGKALLARYRQSAQTFQADDCDFEAKDPADDVDSTLLPEVLELLTVVQVWLSSVEIQSDAKDNEESLSSRLWFNFLNRNSRSSKIDFGQVCGEGSKILKEAIRWNFIARLQSEELYYPFVLLICLVGALACQ
jgi:hypothetical protein